jgi:dihydroxyacetone kinase
LHIFTIKKVSVKFIQDDCALESEDKAVGRRGLLGGIATIKILGAASERGYSLEKMEELFENVTNPANLGTIGFAVSGCSLPVGESGIKLEAGEVELGLGKGRKTF